MIRILIACGFVLSMAYSQELVLPDWKMLVINDVKEQKILTYSKEQEIGDRKFKMTITQVRNNDVWYWSQSFAVLDEVGKWNRLARNMVYNDGKDIARWYIDSKMAGSDLVIGIAEKGGYFDIKEGQRYLCIKFSIGISDEERIFFVDQGNGIFEGHRLTKADDKMAVEF